MVVGCVELVVYFVSGSRNIRAGHLTACAELEMSLMISEYTVVQNVVLSFTTVALKH